MEHLAELGRAAAAAAGLGRSCEIIAGAELFAAASGGCVVAALQGPQACIVLQGTKEAAIGHTVLAYAAGDCFVGAVDLPVTSRITSADRARPYIALTLALDPAEIAELAAQVAVAGPSDAPAYALAPLPETAVDAVRRLLALARAPQDAAVLGPMLRREILYRLLQGPHGPALLQAGSADPRIGQVRRAIDWIRGNVAETVPVADMAACAGMAEATFRRHFRVATGMSPVQFQKMLRLQEARRLLRGGTEVGPAAHSVGYGSASQFSRDYSRAFGLPPSREGRQPRLQPAAGGTA